MKKFSVISAVIAMIGVLLVSGIAFATSDFSYQSYTVRPGNFIMNDVATVSGFNSFQASTLADAGGIYEMTHVETQPVDMALGAPLETSHQQIYLDFFKHGTSVDPAVQETVDSKITVGSTSTAVIPTLSPTGSFKVGTDGKTGMGEGYDLFQSTVGGVVGTPVSSSGHITGINGVGAAGSPRYVFSDVLSAQDDYIWAQGADSAGAVDANGNTVNTLISFTTASVGSSTVPEGTPYVAFDWQDTRGYGIDTDGWTIQNTIDFNQILPSDFRTHSYIGMFP